MRFLVDMPLSPDPARWLRDRGHDATNAVESGLDRASDSAIVAQAKRESRTIVTADLDYPRLLALSAADGPSLILFRDGNWNDADVIRRMDEVLGALTDEDIARSIIVVDHDRVRRRRLPIER